MWICMYECVGICKTNKLYCKEREKCLFQCPKSFLSPQTLWEVSGAIRVVFQYDLSRTEPACDCRQRSEHSFILCTDLFGAFLITSLIESFAAVLGKWKVTAPEQNSTECNYNCYYQPSFVTDYTSICVFTESECPHTDFPVNDASRPAFLPRSFPVPQLVSTGSAEGCLHAVLLPGADPLFTKTFLQKTQGFGDQVCWREGDSELVTMIIWFRQQCRAGTDERGLQ